jgi:hypothetical protein
LIPFVCTHDNIQSSYLNDPVHPGGDQKMIMMSFSDGPLFSPYNFCGPAFE